MSSGNLSLQVTESVSWESFPDQAQRFLDRFDGRVVERIDTPVERMWIVIIRERRFWLTFDDYPPGLSLDSTDSLCNPVIQELHRSLSAS